MFDYFLNKYNKNPNLSLNKSVNDEDDLVILKNSKIPINLNSGTILDELKDY